MSDTAAGRDPHIAASVAALAAAHVFIAIHGDTGKGVGRKACQPHIEASHGSHNPLARQNEFPAAGRTRGSKYSGGATHAGGAVELLNVVEGYLKKKLRITCSPLSISTLYGIFSYL
jgi:hypothetical protein